jgi:Ca-activated chloride channel family protein
VLFLASCAGSSIDNSAANAPLPEVSNEPREAADAANIIVTGSRVSANQKAMRAEGYAMAPPPAPGMTGWGPPYHDEGRDKFTNFAENSFHIVRQEPVSTFSIDVDTASYSWVRASLNQKVLPQPAAVRTEEMVNYFHYDYARPQTTAQPFSTNVAVFPSPWAKGRKLVRIGIRGYDVQRTQRPRSNLVFLIDTSGSMNEPNKLPLVKQSLAMLINELDERDTVAIVTYAGSAGTALQPTPVAQKRKILDVIEQLGAMGSTAGAEGIRQAYNLAEANYDPRGVNRVILATDGDFNVGITNEGELKGYIERERAKGVFLSVLGFGMGNYNDALMQTLAQNGNGTAAYIDTAQEARKTLVQEAGSTLFTIAKDVKIQVEFNPRAVAEYRLIGYETRALNRDDFDNDKVDAGDVGSGQTVTALYEVVPVGGPSVMGGSRYDAIVGSPRVPVSELGFVKIRYKLPRSDTSRLITTPINASVQFASFDAAPRDARFATAVAGFAELLRGGRYNGSLSYDDVLRIATAARGSDEYGYRSEFLDLVRSAKGAKSLAALER